MSSLRDKLKTIEDAIRWFSPWWLLIGLIFSALVFFSAYVPNIYKYGWGAVALAATAFTVILVLAGALILALYHQAFPTKTEAAALGPPAIIAPPLSDFDEMTIKRLGKARDGLEAMLRMHALMSFLSELELPERRIADAFDNAIGHLVASGRVRPSTQPPGRPGRFDPSLDAADSIQQMDRTFATVEKRAGALRIAPSSLREEPPRRAVAVAAPQDDAFWNEDRKMDYRLFHWKYKHAIYKLKNLRENVEKGISDIRAQLIEHEISRWQ